MPLYMWPLYKRRRYQVDFIQGFYTVDRGWIAFYVILTTVNFPFDVVNEESHHERHPDNIRDSV